MSRLKLAVVGLGRLGGLCARAVAASQDLALAGIVRRPERLAPGRRSGAGEVPVVSHLAELGDIDAALLCLPSALVTAAAYDALQQRTCIVECSADGAMRPQERREVLGRLAVRHRAVAVFGAGWAPGAVDLVGDLFALLQPHGHTTVADRPGVSLHHSAAARAVPGVRDALATEVRSASGTLQHYVYVELEAGADPAAVADEIRGDPTLMSDEVLVFPVTDLARLEDEGHGLLMERRGRAAGVDHQLLLLEGRFDRAALAAEMMLAAARALPHLGPGAYTLADIPPRALWGARPPASEAGT